MLTNTAERDSGRGLTIATRSPSSRSSTEDTTDSLPQSDTWDRRAAGGYGVVTQFWTNISGSNCPRKFRYIAFITQIWILGYQLFTPLTD